MRSAFQEFIISGLAPSAGVLRERRKAKEAYEFNELEDSE
jgi:hypothetical protein